MKKLCYTFFNHLFIIIDPVYSTFKSVKNGLFQLIKQSKLTANHSLLSRLHLDCPFSWEIHSESFTRSQMMFITFFTKRTRK